MLSHDEMAAFLNGYVSLWHPAAAILGQSLPKIGSPYDHEQPGPKHIYAVPEEPQGLMSQDWWRAVADVGAIVFRANPDRQTTLDNLMSALSSVTDHCSLPNAHLLLLTADQSAPFLGLGFGVLVLDALFDAMEHENLIERSKLWGHVHQAIGALPDTDACRQHLESAAGCLLTARESLYSVDIHLLDFHLLDATSSGNGPSASLEMGVPFNLVTNAACLERWNNTNAAWLERIRKRLSEGSLEVCGGLYLEREEGLLPIESRLWNLRKGMAVLERLLGKKIETFARRFLDVDPGMPALLKSVGLNRAILVPFGTTGPTVQRSTTACWTGTDGTQVDAFTRTPYPGDSPETYFHLAHYLHQTIMQDHTATLGLGHANLSVSPWHRDWLELGKLSPVLGKWTTVGRYLDKVRADEYGGGMAAEEVHHDYLTERVAGHRKLPVTWFAQHTRWRRRIDMLWTLAALQLSLTGKRDESVLDLLSVLEDQLETNAAIASDSAWQSQVENVQVELAGLLSKHLLARAAGPNRGYLLLNPCSFTRRMAIELPGHSSPLNVQGPVKACQIDKSTARLVVEVPALGFAWVSIVPAFGSQEADIPRSPHTTRMKLADQHSVRNEFFEADIDPVTGGLKAIRDHRTRLNRLGQQLVFNPGSFMKVREINVTSAGPALGEIVSVGTIVDAHETVLATFRQRFRAWLGRPILELRIELEPRSQPEGFAWHAYYAARFAWRDERAVLLCGVNGTSQVTSLTRPLCADYLEIRLGNQRTTIFPAGLPFHQRHGGRMLDMILITEGESGRVFDLAIGLDRDYPMHTAQGMLTPPILVPTEIGPPHVGPTGWLFHLDASNLLLTSMRPGTDGSQAILARLVEGGSHGIQAALRCVRDPREAYLVDAWGDNLFPANIQGDAVSFEASQGSLLTLRVEF